LIQVSSTFVKMTVSAGPPIGDMKIKSAHVNNREEELKKMMEETHVNGDEEENEEDGEEGEDEQEAAEAGGEDGEAKKKKRKVRTKC